MLVKLDKFWFNLMGVLNVLLKSAQVAVEKGDSLEAGDLVVFIDQNVTDELSDSDVDPTSSLDMASLPEGSAPFKSYAGMM